MQKNQLGTCHPNFDSHRNPLSYRKPTVWYFSLSISPLWVPQSKCNVAHSINRKPLQYSVRYPHNITYSMVLKFRITQLLVAHYFTISLSSQNHCALTPFELRGPGGASTWGMTKSSFLLFLIKGTGE